MRSRVSCMTIRRALLAAALVSTAVPSAWAEEAPLYQGRSAEAWVAQLADEEPRHAREASEALRALGPAALDVVRGWRDEPDPRVRAGLVTVRIELARDVEELARLMEQARRDEDPGVREHAAHACAGVQPWLPTSPGTGAGTDASRGLLPALPHAQAAACPAGASARLSPPRPGWPPFDVEDLSENPPRYDERTIEEWIELFVGDPGARDDAAAVLARLPAHSAAAWVRMVERGDAPVGAGRSWTPWNGAERSPAVRWGLRRLVDGRDCEVVERVAWSLGLGGVAARDALPSLIAAARDDGLVGADCDGRVAAIRAIAAIGVLDAEVERALVEFLDHREPAVSGAAAEALAAFGPLAVPHVPRLASLLAGAARDLRELGEQPRGSESRRYWAAWSHVASVAEAIEEMGVHARAAEPVLLDALSAARDPEDAEPFARALRATWGLDGLIERLRSEETASRDVAFAVVPHLIDQVEHAPARLEHESWPLLDVLCEALTGKDADLRSRAMAVVTAFPDAACDFAVCLAPALASDVAEVASASATALVAVTEESILHSAPCVLDILTDVETDARARPTVETIRASLRRARDRQDLHELDIAIGGGADADWLLTRARALAARCPERLERLLDRTERRASDPAVHASVEMLRAVVEEVGAREAADAR